MLWSFHPNGLICGVTHTQTEGFLLRSLHSPWSHPGGAAQGSREPQDIPITQKLSLKKTDFVHQTKYQENHTAGQTPNPWVFKLTSTKVQAGYGGILCMMICCSLNKNLMGSIPVLALQLDQWIYKITTAPNLQGTLQRVCAYGFHYERPLAATVAPW